MNRKDIEELLNGFMSELYRNVKSLDEFAKECLLWNSAVQENIKLQRSGNNVPSIPPTPGATLRFRRILSPIGENPGDEGQGESSAARTSKNTGKDKFPKHLPRMKLSFEEEDATENTESSLEHKCPTNIPGASLQSVQENLCEVKEERKGRRGRRTKQSSVLGRKQPASIMNNTKSNARLTRSITCAVVNDSLNAITLTSVFKPTQENNVNEEGQYQTRRRTKQSSIVRKVQRVTSSRISRSNARKSRSMNRISLNDDLDIVDGISQDSLNASHVTSHSSVSRSLKGVKEATTIISANSIESDKKSQNSNCNGILQDSLNSSTVTETLATVTDQNSSNAVGSKQQNNNTESSKSIIPHNIQNGKKILSICLTRIDDTCHKLQRTQSEEFPKVAAVHWERRMTEGAEKKSLNAATASAQKRANSCEAHCPSKRSRYDKNVQEIEVEQVSENVQKTINTSEDSDRRKSKRITSSKHSETNKNKGIIEIQSFAEISIAPTMLENDILFQELSKEHNKSQCGNADSGKGNSNNGLEHSEYYSLVDTDEVTQDDRDTCPASRNKSVNNGKVRLKPSIGKKQLEILHAIQEQNTPTPERTVSRKGGRSPALFSAYANEPVKNRVAAYEGLSIVTEELQIPATNKRVTRTKTRAMAAAAAAARAAAEVASATGATLPKGQLNNSRRKSGPTVKVSRASWRLKKKINNSAKKNDASKENSFQLNSSKNTDRYYKNISGMGGKILADVNGLFSPVLNNSKKTPMTGPRTIPFNNLSASQVSRSGYRPGVILCTVDTFIKKPVMKSGQDTEIKKLEEQKKREEKEREALRRREELLKKQAEEKKKKRDEIRMRVLEKREAQEKEKQECQLRVGKEKYEKWHILQQEREAKQKGNVLKKKLESERKAAEARRKLEEAEAARVAKLKMEELQHKKEQEEERLRLIAEEREAAIQRDKAAQNMKVLAAMAKTKAENKKNVPVLKLPIKVVPKLDSTFTKPLDSTFTVQSSSKTKQNLDNAYNLEEIESGDSDDEDSLPKETARWALKSALLHSSTRELRVNKRACHVLCIPEINISSIFPKKAFKRTSSAIWATPPRYSVLPKY